jgi:hypothetical protein
MTIHTPNPATTSLAERERLRLARQPGCRFVEAEEFAALAVSWRKMERRNVPSCDVLGLYDLESQEWFLIDKEKFTNCLESLKA